MQISAQHVNTILAFLERVQINGSEAPAFMECVMLLRSLIIKPPTEAEIEDQPAKTAKKS